MKATRFMMMFVAAAAMMFASCGKDNNEGNSSNIPQTDIANNTLVYDGVTYQMEPLPAGNAPSSASKDSIDGEPLFFFDGYHFRDESMWNKTINLAALSEGEEYSIRILGSVLDLNCSGWWEAGQAMYWGEIDGHEYENECVFTNGTFGIYGDINNTTVIFDCVLKNGKTLRMKLVTE